VINIVIRHKLQAILKLSPKQYRKPNKELIDATNKDINITKRDDGFRMCLLKMLDIIRI
jgi:hypothetical protein